LGTRIDVQNREPPARRGRLWRLLHLKLVIPLRRSRHPPEYAARGVAVGLLVALTPTVGVQMPVVFLIWLAVRRLRPAWDFHLVIALAWTWVTNVATAPPLYYLYIVSGRMLTGRWDDLQGYERFARRLAETVPGDAGWVEAAWLYVLNLFQVFGVPMFVGCVPWMILGAWAGYVWSLGLLRSLAKARARRASRGRAL
jgi:uncharacterized protein (DUF2062 family)